MISLVKGYLSLNPWLKKRMYNNKVNAYFYHLFYLSRWTDSISCDPFGHHRGSNYGEKNKKFSFFGSPFGSMQIITLHKRKSFWKSRNLQYLVTWKGWFGPLTFTRDFTCLNLLANIAKTKCRSSKPIFFPAES